MDASTARILTPARIVALTLIALAVVGLGYLRFAPDGDSVTVPKGAKAGDLTFERCTYAAEGTTYDAECGTLVVPENRNNSQSRLIALPVTRVRARSAQPAEPVFRLEGGPGGTNMKFPQASRYVADRDLVLVGYRGADGSSVLDCPEVESALKHSTDVLGETFFRSFGDAFRACADRLTDEGVDLAGYGLPQQVEDLEATREALGDEAGGYGFDPLPNSRALFRYEMHTLPDEIDAEATIGTSTLLAAWNAATYVAQIDDERLAEAMSSSAYLDATRAVLRKHGELWFNDESYLVTRQR